jgi:hypothetical protein
MCRGHFGTAVHAGQLQPVVLGYVHPSVMSCETWNLFAVIDGAGMAEAARQYTLWCVLRHTMARQARINTYMHYLLKLDKPRWPPQMHMISSS